MGKKEKRDRSRSKDRKRKKHKRSRSSSTSRSDTSNIKHKKHKKDKKKKNKSKDNNLRSIDDIIAQKLQEKRKGGEGGQNTNVKVEEGNNIKSGMKPMTKAEYDQKQSVVRRVFDEDTGRTRLVKGEFHVYKLARNITIMVTFFYFYFFKWTIGLQFRFLQYTIRMALPRM